MKNPVYIPLTRLPARAIQWNCQLLMSTRALKIILWPSLFLRFTTTTITHNSDAIWNAYSKYNTRYESSGYLVHAKLHLFAAFNNSLSLYHVTVDFTCVPCAGILVCQFVLGLSFLQDVWVFMRVRIRFGRVRASSHCRQVQHISTGLAWRYLKNTNNKTR